MIAGGGGVLPGFEDLEGNKKIKNAIDNQRIRVILGNPPYSGRANSENDNNANPSHPKLQERIRQTYGKNSTAQSPSSIRNTLIQAIRMASDRLEDKGVLGFVVNSAFLDAKSADGFRKCLAEEFAHIYMLNLRGDIRGQMLGNKEGEGENIFNVMVGVAILLLVKDKWITKSTIHYHDIGDYLSREDKLSKLREFTRLDSIEFSRITPNSKEDWINQRGEEFERLIPLKRKGRAQGIFEITSPGVSVKRDSWVFNFSKETLMQSMQKCIHTYNTDLERFNQEFREDFRKRTASIPSNHLYRYLRDKDITADPTKISWTVNLKNNFLRNRVLSEPREDFIKTCMYRPFVKQYIYWDKAWNERQYQLPSMIQEGEGNLFMHTGFLSRAIFPALMSSEIGDAVLTLVNQIYPLYYYDDLGTRHCAISHYALNLFQTHYKDVSITHKEIFYYIYAIFHHKGYLDKYKNSLSKEDPRIGLSKDFKDLSNLGKILAELHVNYDKTQMHTSIEHKQAMLAQQAEGYYDVVKMRRKENTILYNENIKITNIPSRAFEYKINGKSAIDWVIERYRITQNKDSLIKNNPNDYAGGRYVFELICRIIKLSEKSMDLIEEINKKEFE